MKKQVATRMPDRWLQGCCHSLEQHGLDPRAAIEEAIRIWKEQERLEQERCGN